MNKSKKWRRVMYIWRVTLTVDGREFRSGDEVARLPFTACNRFWRFLRANGLAGKHVKSIQAEVERWGKMPDGNVGERK